MNDNTACGYCGFPVYPSEPHSFSDCANFLRSEVVRLQSETPVWHDAKEPPENDGWYVVEDKYTDIRIVYFMAEIGGFGKDNIVRYFGMPIPQPPEEK